VSASVAAQEDGESGITVELRTQEDVVRLRQVVREQAVAQRFSLVEQTKLITAASELGRNAVLHGGGGRVGIGVVTDAAGRRGLRLRFEDQGPGIADIELAMRDGYSTGSGLGLGLSGSKRLSDEFAIDSTPGAGTRVVVTRWRR
jgi:serine/threonine-protein kinase RsbT